MTSSNRTQPRAAVIVVVCVLLMAGVVGLQGYRERHFQAVEVDEQILYVRAPSVMTRLALSFKDVFADLYWIRAIQHYGTTRLSGDPDKHYELLYPLLDLATSLDPRFSIAYRFGALFLSEGAPGGANRPDQAVALLQKAMGANPERWEYPYDIGFVFYRNREYSKAAEWFQKAAGVPGGPSWLSPLVAVTTTRGGDLQTSRLLWQNLLSSEERWVRVAAQRRLMQLDALEQIQQLQSLTSEYQRRRGSPPLTWNAMINAGLLRDVPRDPTGAEYWLDQASGAVTIDKASSLGPLPTEGAP